MGSTVVMGSTADHGEYGGHGQEGGATGRPREYGGHGEYGRSPVASYIDGAATVAAAAAAAGNFSAAVPASVFSSGLACHCSQPLSAPASTKTKDSDNGSYCCITPCTCNCVVDNRLVCMHAYASNCTCACSNTTFA